MFLKSWKSSFYNLCQHSKCEGLGRVGFCPIQFSSKLLQQLFIIFSFQHMLHILICIIVDVHKFQIILFSIYQNRLVCLFFIIFLKNKYYFSSELLSTFSDVYNDIGFEFMAFQFSFAFFSSL